MLAREKRPYINSQKDNNVIDKIRKALTGFRKFSIMVSIIVIGVWFRLSGLIDGGNFVDLIKTTGAAFFAANLIEHVTDTIKKKLEK